jgi:serine/threonine protein kinase
MADHLGQQLGNYRLLQLLGVGGFAEVYLGEHVYLNTQAAIKVLRTQLAKDDLEGFLSEARTIAHLEHPHIIRVLEFGVEGNIPFLVMSYAPNGSLRQCHPKGSRLHLTSVVEYVEQVADALQYAHNEKLIHRDVKPENMLVGRRNEILLSDFGIALIAQSSRYQSTQDVIGTVAYMSPEQIQGKPRPASDQYSLAIVVYEWLSGDRPFHGSFTELCTQHMFASPPLLRESVPEISLQVEQVVHKALAKEPHQRFESVKTFANALIQASQSEKANFVSQKPNNDLLQSSLPPTQPASISQLSDVRYQHYDIHSGTVKDIPALQNEMVVTIRRPLGITIISILMFIQAIFEIVVGFFSFFGSVISSPLAGLLVGWVPLAIGVLLFILAWGLWTLKPWAYWVTLILEIVNIVLHFLGYSQVHSLFAIISGAIFSIIILIYLLVDGNVRRAFRTGI